MTDLARTDLARGALAPDFALLSALGQEPVALSDQRGAPVVLMFVPLAFSSTCTEELCHVSENWSTWGELGAKVFGISIDSPFVNQKWAEEMGVPFPVLSDFNKEAARAYGVLQDDFFGLRGVAKRSVFVVDHEGRIHWSWRSDDPGVLPPFDEIVEAVREVEAVRQLE